MWVKAAAKSDSQGRDITTLASVESMGQTIVVVGAGVSGLTSALLLSQGQSNSITVVAQHMPGDYAAEYASPWAGANFLPLAGSDNQWERKTWRELSRLAADVPEAGVHYQKILLQRRHRDVHDPLSSGFQGAFSPDPWFKVLFDDFRPLNQSEIAPGYDGGFAFTTVCVNTAVYLPWLLGQCVKQGVVIKREKLNHIEDAVNMGHTSHKVNVIVNCTGLGSLTLGGIKDANLTPARGQTVLVQNESNMLMYSGTDAGHGEEMYVMQRAAGGGTVLGGTYELGNWDPHPDPNTALRIMQRVVTAEPNIAHGQGVTGLRVIRHNVGFRPFRAGGARVDRLKGMGGSWIVNNYGHDSWGYLASYGCAEEVVKHVTDIERESGQGKGPTKSEKALVAIKSRL